MVFEALEIPVKGVFDGLEGFDGISEDVNMEGADGGGGALGGAGEAAGGLLGGGGGKGGSGAMKSGKMLGKIGGVVSMLLGPLGIIIGILLMLEPIQATLGMIMSFLEAVIFPFIMPFMVLIGLWMRLIPMLMDFVNDPAGALQDLGGFIIDGLMAGLDLLSGMFDGMLGDVASQIGGFFSPVTDLLGDIKDLFPSGDGKTGAGDMALETTTGFNPEDTDAENVGSIIGGMVIPGPGGKNLGEKAGELVVNIEGDDVEIKGGTERQVNKMMNKKEENKNFFYSIAQSLFG